MMKTIFLSALLTLGVTSTLLAQSPAAIEKLQTLYTPAQIQDMQDHDPAKWNSMVWFYAHSWEVQEAGSYRPATEEEIRLVDLKQYDSQRTSSEAVTVTDAASGLTLRLLSADQCFDALKTVLEPAQWTKLHEQYLRNKAQRDATDLPKSSH